jgi:7-cyano-7-deazaguanine reductase
MSKKQWSNITILKSIKNPSDKSYEIKIKAPEITFLGVKNQPDFARLYIIFYPRDNVIELRSFKIYLQQYRDKIMSYERLINVIYDDLIEKYKPQRLRLVMDFNSRGGISSRLTIDSDWKDRGGNEEYKGWIEDVW